MKIVRRSAVVISFLALAGCQQKGAEPVAQELSAGPVNQLPISINAAMVALTDQSSDYIFAPGNNDMPKSDHDWFLVRNAAYDMMLAGSVIQIPGTGQHDAQWVNEPEWRKLASEMTQVGNRALQLADAKSTDQAKWQQVGDDLVQTCLSCHEKFKPDTPSQGVLHEATKRESIGKSVFR
jgi:hypothetical protein